MYVLRGRSIRVSTQPKPLDEGCEAPARTLALVPLPLLLAGSGNVTVCRPRIKWPPWSWRASHQAPSGGT